MSTTVRQVPLLNLQAQHREIREEVLAEVVRVIDSQRFILGEDVQNLEAEVASYCGTRYAVGCASGSDALRLSLMAVGVGPGDEVVTTPYSFFATAGEISHVGATPVFVDVDESTFNLNPELLRDALAAHPKVRAVIPVHLFGGCADMDPILDAARQRGIAVIEDAAQAIGSEYNGRRAGSMGRLGAFSFYPTKNLGAYGDGGIVTTDDKGLAARLAALRVHGRTSTYFHEWIGINSRLDAIQAAILRVKLRHLDAWSSGRASHADQYRERLAAMHIPVVPPQPPSYQTRHIYNQFVVRCERRDALQAHLKNLGIGCEVYYPLALHLQPCYSHLGYRVGDFPISERLSRETLSLPVQAELGPAEIDAVCEAIGDFYVSTT